MPTGDVALADDEIAFAKASHQIAHLFDHANKFVPNGHGDGDGLLGPRIPVIYMYVRPTDGRFQHPEQDIVPAYFGEGNVLQPKPGLGLRLHDRLHRLLHDAKLTAHFADVDPFDLVPILAESSGGQQDKPCVAQHPSR
jgi:hypothetical protein